MCVWSAYAGKKQAAPILLEALKKTEGYWAGFYTGMATCENGVLHFAKCPGHTGFFEKNFEIFILEFMFGYILSFSRNPVKRSKLSVVLSRLFRFYL